MIVMRWLTCVPQWIAQPLGVSHDRPIRPGERSARLPLVNRSMLTTQFVYMRFLNVSICHKRGLALTALQALDSTGPGDAGGRRCHPSRVGGGRGQKHSSLLWIPFRPGWTRRAMLAGVTEGFRRQDL